MNHIPAAVFQPDDSRRILLIDDADDSLCSLLKEAGYSVYQAIALIFISFQIRQLSIYKLSI